MQSEITPSQIRLRTPSTSDSILKPKAGQPATPAYLLMISHLKRSHAQPTKPPGWSKLTENDSNVKKDSIKPHFYN